MPPPNHEARLGPHRKQRPLSSWFSPVAHALVLAGATAAVFLAGKPQEGAMGVFLLCAGAAMVICPPQVKVDWSLWAVGAALTGCTALALLPSRWVPSPSWRQTLAANLQIPLPATISTTPALTIFWLAILALSLCVGLFLLAHPIRSRWLLVLTLAAMLAAAAYGGLAIYAKQTGWHYPFAGEVDFGFFPNHNHTATLLFMGSLLAVGILGIALREGHWLLGLLAGACLAVCGAGLAFYSASRGGVVFLLAGIALWFAGLGRRRYDTRLVVSFLTLLAAGVILFFLSGGAARDRLLEKFVSPPPASVTTPSLPSTHTADDRTVNPSEDPRIKIYRDALGVVRDFPLTGVGLGTFSLVFPQYRRASLQEARALHPESDWLMLAAEAGIPSVLCLIVLLVLAARSLWGEADHPYWPLRWGCAVAAGTAALHGLVDVPLHRVQLGWWVLSVSGLALQSFRSGKAGPSRVQRAFFIAVGTGALTLGGTLVRAQCFAGKELPPFMVAETEKEVLTRFNRHDIEGATNLARETLKVYPMNASLYLQVGFLLLQFQNTDAEADEVFKAQRLLEPNLSSVPLQQGEIWITIDTDRTAALWLDALARRHRSDRAVGLFQDDGLGFYSDLLRRAASVPAVERKLVSEAIRSPAYAFAWLDNASAPIDPTDWNVLIASADLLKRFSEEERSRFLLIWYAKSDRSALARFLSAHPEWETASRPLRLRQLADSGQFEAAVRQAAGWYSIPLELPALNPATVPVAVAEDADPARAFTQYWKEGNTISAHRVLAEAANVVTPKTAEFYKIETALAAHDARWPEAWVYIQKAVTTEHPETRF